MVPITVKLGEGSPVLLITGPNAGGKTVALKTVGLLSLMAQAGLHIPVREATLRLFDGVYADIGDQQSIQRSLSTFSSHIENLRAIMEEATGRSLVLIDELGTSTDPEEGSALAKAILDHFFQRGITLMAATHHREVAAYVQEHIGMVNASVELDPGSLSPTYRLSVGLPGRSYALTIAARLGLESGVVERAWDPAVPGAPEGGESAQGAAGGAAPGGRAAQGGPEGAGPCGEGERCAGGAACCGLGQQSGDDGGGPPPSPEERGRDRQTPPRGRAGC